MTLAAVRAIIMADVLRRIWILERISTMKKNAIALACAAALSVCTTISAFSASADENVSALTTVMMPRSAALAFQPESKITGEIAIVLENHPVHVNITLYSDEKPSVYYDTDLIPEEDAGMTEYVFPVNFSEYPDQSQLDAFQNTYTADYFSGVYTSCYCVTITTIDLNQTEYQDEAVLIADFHADPVVSGTTKQVYEMTFSEEQEEDFLVGTPVVEITDGNAEISRSVSMRWQSCALGDVDEDGSITLADAYLILMYDSYRAVGIEPDFEKFVIEAADVTHDGAINLTDAYHTMMYNSMLAIGETFTFEEYLKKAFPDWK